ncbi:hypothetical protein ACJRO7_032012 [Eucalyptus globulus]|uniref:Uncharacterized protein n=1 Tax=Eucalyptus globulus TaxID=34317 RepID=A0ABD3JLQ3_EUCGL
MQMSHCHRLPSSNSFEKQEISFRHSHRQKRFASYEQDGFQGAAPSLSAHPLPLSLPHFSRPPRGPATEVLRCLDDCGGEDVQEYITCHKECELRYREREERREEEERPVSRELDPRWQRRRGRRRGRGGGGGEREPEGPRGEREPAWPAAVRAVQAAGEGARGQRRSPESLRRRLSVGEVRAVRARLREAGRRPAEAAVQIQVSAAERARGEGDTWRRDAKLLLATTTEDPQQQFQHCQQRCERQQGREPQRRQCRQECERQFQEQQRGKRRSTNPREQEEEEEEEVGESADNPYYFHRSRFRAEEGQIRVLEQFDKRSRLLRGLKNYRPEIFEANPSTFVLPHRVDADCILIVLKG